MRTVFWDYDRNIVKLIDQRLLPFELVVAEFDDYHAVAQAISDMYVRGAPAIGATAAFGIALASLQSPATDGRALYTDLLTAAEVLNAARPTAVNLSWATRRQLGLAESQSEREPAEIRQNLLAAAQQLADDDVVLNRRMGFFGAELISDGDIILHHCNTGALATVDWGTALGVIFAAHEQGKQIHVLARNIVNYFGIDQLQPKLFYVIGKIPDIDTPACIFLYCKKFLRDFYLKIITHFYLARKPNVRFPFFFFEVWLFRWKK